MGANKVIIYEPVTANHQFIKENVRLNHVNAEIHDEGVGDKNGVIVASYGEANNPYSSLLSSLCFGISQKEPELLSCQKVLHIREAKVPSAL
jgi:FkbM family methyltransferase